MKPTRRSALALPLLWLASACGGSTAAPSTTPPSPSASSPAPPGPGPLGALCERHHARERACATEYLEALVAVRIEVDMPRGIAAEAARDGRAGLLARARAEWLESSKPEVVSPMCAALDGQVPAARVDSLLAQGERCLAAADCKAFAVCEVADQRSYIESGDMH